MQFGKFSRNLTSNLKRNSMADDDFDDWPDEAEDDDTATECPHCGAAVYDDAEQCPACGMYLSTEDVPAKLPPLWIMIGAAVCILIVIAWMLGG